MPRRKPGERPIFSRPKRTGRPPTDPFEVIDHDTVKAPNGRARQVPVTAADRIIDTLRSNGFVHDAAARAGIATETLRAWRTKGTRAQAALLNGRLDDDEIDEHTAACIELARRWERAEADAKKELVDVLLAAARGELIQLKVVEQVDPATGEVFSRRVETLTVPDVKAAMWVLSHKYPEYRGHLEVSGPGGGPIPVDVSPKEQLAAAAERAAERLGVGLSGNGDAG